MKIIMFLFVFEVFTMSLYLKQQNYVLNIEIWSCVCILYNIGKSIDRV